MAPLHDTSEEFTRRSVVGVYTRISRVGGRRGEGFISQADQEERAEAVAAGLRLEIADYWHDPDQTGGNLQRPAWEALMARVLDPADPISGVIVARVDRFARTVPEGAPEVRRIWDSNGGRGVFVAADLPVDTTTPFGRRTLWDWLSSAELDLETKKAAWWVAKRRALTRGAYNARAPFGYQKILKGQPHAGVLEPDPVAGPIVTELFRRDATRAFGAGTHARWLDEVAPKPHGPWTETAVLRILANRVYLGEARYGDHFPPNTEAHEPLTDPFTFGRCQRAPGERRTAERAFLLTGKVRCANCRYAMAGWSNGGSRRDTPVYVCRARACRHRSSITARLLDEHVEALIRPALTREIASAAETDGQLARVEAEVARLRDERMAFASDLDAKRLLGEDWLPALGARTDALEAKVAERDRLAGRSQLADLGRRAADDLDHDELRDFLHAAVRHVFVRRIPGRRRAPVADRALVVWNDDPGEIVIPTVSCPGSPGPLVWDE